MSSLLDLPLPCKTTAMPERTERGCFEPHSIPRAYAPLPRIHDLTLVWSAAFRVSLHIDICRLTPLPSVAWPGRRATPQPVLHEIPVRKRAEVEKPVAVGLAVEIPGALHLSCMHRAVLVQNLIVDPGSLPPPSTGQVPNRRLT